MATTTQHRRVTFRLHVKPFRVPVRTLAISMKTLSNIMASMFLGVPATRVGAVFYRCSRSDLGLFDHQNSVIGNAQIPRNFHEFPIAGRSSRAVC